MIKLTHPIHRVFSHVPGPLGGKKLLVLCDIQRSFCESQSVLEAMNHIDISLKPKCSLINYPLWALPKEYLVLFKRPIDIQSTDTKRIILERSK